MKSEPNAMPGLLLGFGFEEVKAQLERQRCEPFDVFIDVDWCADPEGRNLDLFLMFTQAFGKSIGMHEACGSIPEGIVPLYFVPRSVCDSFMLFLDQVIIPTSANGFIFPMTLKPGDARLDDAFKSDEGKKLTRMAHFIFPVTYAADHPLVIKKKDQLRTFGYTLKGEAPLPNDRN